MEQQVFAEHADLGSFTTSENKYEILGLATDASAEAIKQEYRRLAFLFHPDRHPADQRPQAEAIFKRLSSAYQTLSNPEKRQSYDRWLSQGGTGGTFEDDSEGSVDLRGVLSHIFEYEHAFSDVDLDRLNPTLQNFVRQNLLCEIREEVVGVTPISAAPGGFQYQGNFKDGGLVVTTFRVLIPFRTQWQVRSGNTKTVYTRGYMGTIAFASMTQIELLVEGELRARTSVVFNHQGQKTAVSVRENNLGKLLLLSRLWGVAVAGLELPRRSSELRRVLLWYPLPIALVLYACLAADWHGSAWKIPLLALSFIMGWGARRAWNLVKRKSAGQLLGDITAGASNSGTQQVVVAAPGDSEPIS